MPYESILCSIFAYRYRTSGHSASQSRIGTFFLLLDLMQFFDLYHAGQHDTALDVSFVFEQILAGVFVPPAFRNLLQNNKLRPPISYIDCVP